MRRLQVLPLLLAMLCGAVCAEDAIHVCYNYGCATEEIVIFSDARLAAVREMLVAATTPDRERELLALVIGQFYTWAGEQTPIWRDRARNDDDEDEQGRMDCIDHSTTTDGFLRLLEGRGWLRFHRVLPVQRRMRFFVSQHFAAAIEELGPLRDTGDAKPERFAVDSWFVDNGQPAVILPLEEWMDGGGSSE
jgi:hypothetical protein